jgi:uncharacterized OB-fold protein
MKDHFDPSDCATVDGKLALPYTYFAGRVGSRFLTTVRDHRKILGVKCNTCDKVFVPPRQTCERCMEDLRDHWVELGDSGTLENFTVVRYADKHLPRNPPFILGLIRLDGADTPLVHIVGGIDIDQVVEGIKVKAVFSEQPENTILGIDRFEPI